MSHVVRHSRKDAEFRIQVLVDRHDGCYVSAAVAVVGCRPHCNHRVLWKVEFVTLVHKLMSSGDEFQSVDVVELCRNLVSEQPSSSTRADGPRINVLGITPHKITEGTLMRNLLCTSNNADLVDGADLRRQSTVYTEYFAIDDGCQDQEVKDLATCLPYASVAVFLLAFFVEAIHLRNLTGLVVSAD